ncbi:uncharacterized protein LOC121432185 [Lytechinus variegatus]|uniref:uncharacterized protein LOC121432185 n=1 Tax=Lytechinus variegatus TaxID=7654 RepID=UPI001BB1ECF5|nr:uncharacterized protein LOC121432185 [Lytechinus variegatus]
MDLKSKLTLNWGWVVTFASFLLHFFVFGIMTCFSITFVTLQEEFSTDSTATSWAGSIALGLATSAGVIVTPLINRFENRPVGVFGILLASISYFSTSFITDFRLIYFTYSASFGLGVGFCSLASMDLLLRYFPRKHCSRATLITLVGASSGMLALGPLTYTLIENWGWRNMFRFLGALMLIISLPATMTFSRPKPHQNERIECVSGKRVPVKNIKKVSLGMIFGNPEDATQLTEDKVLEQDRSNVCMTAFDNAGFSMEGVNQRRKSSRYKRLSGSQNSMDADTAEVIPAKELRNNALTPGNKDGCQVLRSKSGPSTDLPGEGKVGFQRLGPSCGVVHDLVLDEKKEQLNQQSKPQTSDLQKTTVVQPEVLSFDMIAEDTVASFKTIDMSSSIPHSTITDSDIKHVEDVKEGKEDTFPHVVVQPRNSEVEKERGFFQRYRALFYPDLWLICICITGLPMMNTFYYVNMGDFLISRGFERHVIPWVVTTFGISELAGKILLAVVADRLPFPKIFIYNFACAVGMVVMGCLLVVRSVALLLCIAVAIGMIVMMVANALSYSICNQIFRPQDVLQTWTVVMVTQGFGYMLGALFGQSIDRTGSYNSAIFSSIGIYALCALVCTAVPLYQKFFAPERFVMFENQDACRRTRTMKKRYKPDDLVDVDTGGE